MSVFGHEQKLYYFINQVVQFVTDLQNRRILRGLTFCKGIDIQIKDIQNTLIGLHQFCQENIQHSNLISVYKDLLHQIQLDLEDEKIKIIGKTQLHQNINLPLLQSCKVSYLQDEKKILKYVEKQMREYQNSINQSVKEIQEMQQEIRQLQTKPFLKTIHILNDLDYDKIKRGYIFKESQQSKDFFSSKKEVIEHIISDVQKNQGVIKKQIFDVRLIEQNRNALLYKAHSKIININIEMANKISKLCFQLNSFYQPQQLSNNYHPTIVQSIKFGQNNLQNFKSFYKSIANHLTQKSPKIQAGKIYKSLSEEYKIKQQENLVSLYHSESKNMIVKLIFQNASRTMQAKVTLQLYRSLILSNILEKMPRTLIKGNFLIFSSFDQKLIVKGVQTIHRHDECILRLVKLKRRIFRTKNDDAGIQIRAMLYGFRYNFGNVLFYQVYLSSYKQTISGQENKLISKYDEIHNSQSLNSSWFQSIFKSRISSQQKLKTKQKILRKYYYQQMLSLAHLYILNMIALQINHEKIRSFKCLVQIALNIFTIQQAKILQDSFKKIQHTNKEEAMKFLTNDRIIQNIMINIADPTQSVQILLPQAIKGCLNKK